MSPQRLRLAPIFVIERNFQMVLQAALQISVGFGVVDQ